MISRLSLREKIFVFSGAAVLLILILWLGVFRPYQNGLAIAKIRIHSRQRQLKDVRQLQQEYFSLQRAMTTAEKKLSGTTRGFTLFPFIEAVTSRLGVRDKLVSMRPQPAQIQGDYREESVKIRLERINLSQLVRLLYGIEESNAALHLKKVRIKPRFDNRNQFDTDLIISSLQRTS
ncbi:MAG: type II secretion system protein M [Deltaproteobacteria bacterium]|nr:type II secretion system protein M [Deltaproteobacteria bacterium]